MHSIQLLVISSSAAFVLYVVGPALVPVCVVERKEGKGQVFRL